MSLRMRVKEIIGNIDNGTVVDIVTSEMEFLARACVAMELSAIARVLTTKDEKIDKDFFYSRIKSAYEKKTFICWNKQCQSFYSEADLIPGLIIDKFDKYVSVQFRNSGLEVFRQHIINAIKKYLKPKAIRKKWCRK